MRGRSRWPWVTAGAGLAGLAVLLVVTAIPLRDKDGLATSANTAQLTALLVAVGTAAAVMVRWAWRTVRSAPAAAAPTTEALALAKDMLAGVVAEQWKHEAALRSLDDPDPIPVRWRTPERAAVMDHAANIEAAAPAEGGLWWTASSADIAALVDRFRRTRRRRLVILGGPGAGKTTLAVQLLLHLLATRDEHPDEPVPVMLPVADWDTEQFPRVHEWLADRLSRDYPMLRSPKLGGDVTRALTARGYVLAVLDGLDELPPRAQATVITALNRSLGDDDQLILTSRTSEFAAAVTAAGDVVTSAAVLEPRPLDPPAVAGYLTRCLPPGPGPVWDQILAELRKAPAAEPTEPVAALAEVAATPLGLWLLRSVYTAPGADPAELTRFATAAALRTHLYDHIIDALIAIRPPSKAAADLFRPRRRHDPARVRRWLGYLAHHHNDQPATTRGDPGQGTRDFAWWRLAATTNAINRTALLVLALVLGLIPALLGGLMVGVASDLTSGVAVGIAFAVGGAVTMGFVVRPDTLSWTQEAPGYADLRVRGRLVERVRRLGAGLLGGLSIGLLLLVPGGLPGEFPFGLLGGLVTGLVLGIGIGVATWAETPAQIHDAATPLRSWRADRTLNLLRTTVVGVAIGGAFGLAGGLVFGLASALMFGPWAGLMLGAHRAWPVYLVATWRLAQARLLPRRLMPFLDDCHRLGLLRAVGPTYQFRHADLQDHLAATYHRPA